VLQGTCASVQRGCRVGASYRSTNTCELSCHTKCRAKENWPAFHCVTHRPSARAPATALLRESNRNTRRSIRRHARYYFVLRDRARVFAGRVFARLCPTAAFTIALSALSSSFSF
jgi:hypothetical protein